MTRRGWLGISWIAAVVAATSTNCDPTFADAILVALEGGPGDAGDRDDAILGSSSDADSALGDGPSDTCGSGQLLCGNRCVPNDTTNCGTCGHPCTASAQCIDGSCQLPNYAFVTSAIYFASEIGGVSGANTICNNLARAAGLPTNFAAYISASSRDARDVLTGGRGWIRTDGKPIADSAAQFANGRLWYPISLDERGNTVSSSNYYVLTGTDDWGGRTAGYMCNDWTSNTGTVKGGYVGSGYAGFQSYWYGHCAPNPGRLYCVQNSANVPITLTKVSGRYMFLTQTTFDPSQGVAQADTNCQSEASAAGLPGTYLALLSTPTASAISRFDTSLGPWVRPDGVQIVATGRDMATFTLISPPCLDATGTSYMGNYGTAAGATGPNDTGLATTTCKNWSDKTSSYSASIGTAGFVYMQSEQDVFSTTTTTCDQTAFTRVYCLQQ
jgi:hypothetical protein